MSLSWFTVKPLEVLLAPPKYNGSLVHRSVSMTLRNLLLLSLGRNITCQNRKIPLLKLCTSKTRKKALKSLPNWPELLCNLLKSFSLREFLSVSQVCMFLFFILIFSLHVYFSSYTPLFRSSGTRWAFYKGILKLQFYSSFLSCRRNKKPWWGHKRKEENNTLQIFFSRNWIIISQHFEEENEWLCECIRSVLFFGENHWQGKGDLIKGKKGEGRMACTKGIFFVSSFLPIWLRRKDHFSSRHHSFLIFFVYHV